MMLLFVADNITLPSVKGWLADRLASFYHKRGSISPSCPTLAKKQKELDFAYHLSYTLSLVGVSHAKKKRTNGRVY
jgi:hypothetical protein